MRHFKSLLALLIIGYAASCAPAPSSESDLKTALSNFATAFQSGDYDMVASYIANDYMHVNSGAAPYDRSQWLRWYQEYAREIINGDHVFEHYVMDDVEIVIHGDAAYVTGVIQANGVRHGEAFSQSLRFTNLWIVEHQRWKRLGFHDAVANPDV